MHVVSKIVCHFFLKKPNFLPLSAQYFPALIQPKSIKNQNYHSSPRLPSREESNLRQWIQSPLCYHYTTRRAHLFNMENNEIKYMRHSSHISCRNKTLIWSFSDLLISIAYHNKATIGNQVFKIT